MDMRALGTTGVHVSHLCLGAAMFGRFGNTDERECEAIVHTALDAGINFIDTSDVYSFGESETLVGKALRGRRHEVVLATKFGLPMSQDPNTAGGSRRWIMREVERSLTRLGTDYIDLYQMHRPDHRTDIDDTLSALSDLVRQGKIRMFGSSTFPAERIVEAHWCAERRGHARFRTEQPPYSILARRIEGDVLPTCERYGMGVLVWSPLAQGWLSGKHRRGQPSAGTHRAVLQPQLFDPALPDTERKYAAVESLEGVAADHGISLLALALGFVKRHPAVTSAIIGPRTLPQLHGLLEAADVSLDDATLDRIDAIVPPGTSISREDDGYVPPELADSRLRRRPPKAASPPPVSGRVDRLRDMFGDEGR
jgi:aryl-alcohol dehydrogenase-like predicted oxidoreductase